MEHEKRSITEIILQNLVNLRMVRIAYYTKVIESLRKEWTTSCLEIRKTLLLSKPMKIGVYSSKVFQMGVFMLTWIMMGIWN